MRLPVNAMSMMSTRPPQVVFILEKVHIIWEPILPKSTYRRTMCILLEFVFKAVIKDILLLDDIAAEETLQVRCLSL